MLNALQHHPRKAFMKYLLSVLCLTVLLLSACAGKEKFNEQLNSWNGKDINAYIRANGYPTSQQKLPNGNIVYVFSKSNTVYMPAQTQMYPTGQGTYQAFTTGGVPINKSCTIWMEANQADTIVNWRWEGNSCY